MGLKERDLVARLGDRDGWLGALESLSLRTVLVGLLCSWC